MREELIRPLNHFVNQTLYCSQTTAETETETVEYIGEITSQPPSIAARSIMHTKVNCSLISASRRTTCLFKWGFGELLQTCGTGEQSRTCSGMFQISNVFLHFPEFPRNYWHGRLSNTSYGVTYAPVDRAHSGLLTRVAWSPEWQADRSTFRTELIMAWHFLFFKEISVGSNCVGLGRKEGEYWPDDVPV